MEELTSQSMIREGACLAPQESDEDDLPLVLWLRGDEAICDEFTVDAETAMHRLGIKRSRLTQISGRELRVGKIRIDRYIRPVYRLIDIENYLQWTRASASHQKSAQAIELAAKKMDEQRETLLQWLEEFTQNFQSTSAQEWRAELKAQSRLFLAKFQLVEEALQQLGLDQDRNLQREMKRLNRVEKMSADQLDALQYLASGLNNLQDIFGHFHEQQLKHDTLLQTLTAQLKNASEHFTSRQNEILSFCERAQKELYAMILDCREAVTAPMPEIKTAPVKPRRTIPVAQRRRGPFHAKS